MVIALMGFLIGFLLAVPAGPAAVLIVKNTGQRSFRAGLDSLLGLVLAELVYIALFLSGIYQVITEAPTFFMVLKTLGALLVLSIGYKALRGGSHLAREAAAAVPQQQTGDKPTQRVLTTLTITLFNPAILLFMIGALATLASYLGRSPDFKETLNLLVFMEIGCIVWFVSLIYFTFRIRHRFLNFFDRDFQRYSAWILILLGLYMLIEQVIKGSL